MRTVGNSFREVRRCSPLPSPAVRRLLGSPRLRERRACLRKFCIFVTASGLWQVFETPAGGWMDRLTGPPLRCPTPALEGLPGRGLSLSGLKAPSCWLARSVAPSLVPGTVHHLLESLGWTPTTPPHTHRRLTTLPSTPWFSPRRPTPFQNFIWSASTSSLPLPLPGRELG